MNLTLEKKMLNAAVEKLSKTSERIKSSIPNVSKEGKYNDETLNIRAWTNGFWPGILWLMYKNTKEVKYAVWANECEDKLDLALDNFAVDHDAGFIWGLSSVYNYRITGYNKSRIRALKAASFLASRFNSAGNFIRAWDGKGKEGWAIIDCMMNLPLLYWASSELDDPRFRQIAMKHADMVMEHFIREDGSTHHIVKFDPYTGKRVGAEGGQGYAPDSSWGRGTSWALHGFTLSYKYTKEERYLATAKKVAEFFIDHLPEDKVPTADFKAPNEEKNKKDATAGAIAASGLALLHQVTGEECYKNSALEILKGLNNTCKGGEDEEALLIHGNVAYHFSAPYDDIPIIYGDYYYLEALLRLNGWDD